MILACLPLNGDSSGCGCCAREGCENNTRLSWEVKVRGKHNRDLLIFSIQRSYLFLKRLPVCGNFVLHRVASLAHIPSRPFFAPKK